MWGPDPTQELIVAGLDGVLTVIKLEDIYHHKLKNNALYGADEKKDDSSGSPPWGTKTEAHAPKYQPMQAKKLGPIVALTSGRILHGSEKKQLLACTADGWLHIFDFQCESGGFREIREAVPMFTLQIPSNVFAIRVLDSVMVASPSPIIVLVTNEVGKGPIGQGFVHFMYLQFKEHEAAGEPHDLSFLPHLVLAMKYDMGGEIASIIVNPYPRLSALNSKGENLGRATSGTWTIAVGFEGGGIGVLSVRPHPSAGEGFGGKLEVNPVPMKTGGGIPMSIWGWNGVAFVFGPFRRGEGFGVCTVDGRVAYIEVKVEHEEGEEEEDRSNSNSNQPPLQQCNEDNNDEEYCLNLGDIDETVMVAGPLWSTRWCHQTRETFFHGGALPLGTTSASTMQALLHLNQRCDAMDNRITRNESDALEPFAVCSWGGVTMICDSEGRTSPTYFDPRDFIESPLRAFTCGSITLRKGLDSCPALIYATGTGEIVIYHSIWDEIGQLNSVAEPSFEEMIFRGGGLQSLQVLLNEALDRLDKYEKLELSQPQWKEEGELAKSKLSPLPQTWKDLASLSRFLLERGPTSATMDLCGPPFVTAMRESISPILNEIDQSCSGDGSHHHPSLYSKPNLQKMLNRLALASRAEKLNI